MSHEGQEKGLRFETGLIVILVMLILAVFGALACNSLDSRIDRLEATVFDGVAQIGRSQ